ncbi:MAG: hypothetical protein QXM93_08220 [Candidatus Methanomethyliaceae archaeon]
MPKLGFLVMQVARAIKRVVDYMFRVGTGLARHKTRYTKDSGTY